MNLLVTRGLVEKYFQISVFFQAKQTEHLNRAESFNHLTTKRNLFHIKIQPVPRSKHSSPRL